MPINYPLDLVNQIDIQRFEMSFISSVAVTRSPFTFVQQVQSYPGQLWGAEVTLRPLSDQDVKPWQSFILKLNGQLGTFLMGDPTKLLPQGTAQGTPVLNGAGQTGQTINVRGFTPNQPVALADGDHIQIGTHLYQVLSVVSSDGSGNAVVDIFPRLREASIDGEVVITSNARGLFRLEDNSETVQSVDQKRIVQLSFRAVEAI